MKAEKAALIFNKLIDYGREHRNDQIKIDYFAVSLPDMLIFEDDLDIRNKIHCHYLTGLGLLGLKDMQSARQEFELALQQDVMHFGASTHLMASMRQEQPELI